MSSQEKQSWLRWFKGLEPEQAEAEFVEWGKLKARKRELQLLVDQVEGVSVSAAKQYLRNAEQKLDYKRNYRIAVIGESGAGKSTLINAILRRNLLPTETGDSVTGTEVRISSYEGIDLNSEKVKLSFKTEDSFFIELINSITLNSTGNDLLDKGTNAESAIGIIESATFESSSTPDWIIQRLPKELLDIAITWKAVSQGNHDIREEYRIEEKEELDSLLKESSSKNDPSSEGRVIPAIAYAEYCLASDNREEQESLSLDHVEIIDTPGINATTLRHYEILLKVVKSKPDAVVLVVRADRPGAKAVEMAHLLENMLLSDFDASEKSDFARKVFLVINRSDQLLSGQGNRDALDKAIKRICDIISKDYWDIYTRGTEDNKRYFEAMSLLSFLASQKINNGSLSEEEENIYESQVKLFGSKDADKLPDWFNDKSEIPNLVKRINTFLSKERVGLMLREAKEYLSLAERCVETVCLEKLKRYGITEVDSAEEEEERQIQVRCKSFLNRDRKELKRLVELLQEDVEKWIHSKEHKNEVSKQLNVMFSRLEKELEKEISDCLNDSRDDTQAFPELPVVEKSYYYLGGKSYTDGVPRKLLRKVEWKFHEIVEKESKHIAEYYTSHLSSLIIKHEVDKQLKGKSYEQDYIEKLFEGSLAPTQELRKKQTELFADYESICRWNLMYELVKMPILADFEKSEANLLASSVKEAMSTLIPVFGLAITEAISRTATAPWSVFLDAIKEILERQIPESPEEKSSKDKEVAKISDLFSSLEDGFVHSGNELTIDGDSLSMAILSAEELIPKIGTLINNREFDKIIMVVRQQFALRYGLAIGTALAFLERLFQYEFGKYCIAFEGVSQQLIEQHISFVNAGNVDIREKLLKKHSVEQGEIKRIIGYLRNLEKIKTQTLASSIAETS